MEFSIHMQQQMLLYLFSPFSMLANWSVYLSWITLWYVCLSFSSVVTCYTPQNVTNGKSLWDSERRPTYGETVHYTCNKGYVLVGKSSTKCTKTGEYDSEPPECKGKHSTSMRWTCWLLVSINAIKAPFQLFSPCVVFIFLLFSQCRWVWGTRCIFGFLFQHSQTQLNTQQMFFVSSQLKAT